MNITYRKLKTSDLNAFAQMRINQLQEEGAAASFDLLPSLLDFYTRHLGDGTFVSWIAADDGTIIATSGISFVEKPPYYSNPTGKIGILSSMYTKAPYRRQGIARTLLCKITEEARIYGCGVIQLTASDTGVLLYKDFGFEKSGNFMQYKL